MDWYISLHISDPDTTICTYNAEMILDRIFCSFTLRKTLNIIMNKDTQQNKTFYHRWLSMYLTVLSLKISLHASISEKANIVSHHVYFIQRLVLASPPATTQFISLLSLVMMERHTVFTIKHTNSQ